VAIGDGCSIEDVDKVCYRRDMLSVDRDAVAAMTVRIHRGWLKFKSFSSLKCLLVTVQEGL